MTFGDVAATSFTVVSSTQLRAVAPPHAPGAVDVLVTTTRGQSAADAAEVVTYIEDPTEPPTP